jgi:glucose-6-phosphate 1-dehydrogenase
MFCRIRGDQQHFVRRDELKVRSVYASIHRLSQQVLVECWFINGCNSQASWEIFTPLLHRIDKGEFKSIPYKSGSRGPAEADKMLEKAGYVQTHGYIWIPPTL